MDRFTFEDYVGNVGKRQRRGDNERLGQAYFNELSLTRPELADEVRGSYFDPYYDDNAVGEFLTFVMVRW